MKVPDNFSVFFVNGGATLQFSAVPYNLCSSTFGTDKVGANFLRTG